MGKLRIRFVNAAGLGSVPALVERLATGQFLQADGKTFAPPPPLASWPPPTVTIPEAGPGRYALDLDASAFPDGNYAVYEQEHSAPAVSRALAGATIHGGDDGYVPPPTSFILTPPPAFLATPAAPSGS